MRTEVGIYAGRAHRPEPVVERSSVRIKRREVTENG